MRRLQFPALLLRCPSSSSSDELRSSTGESCSPKNEPADREGLSRTRAVSDLNSNSLSSASSSSVSLAKKNFQLAASEGSSSSSCPRGLNLSDLQSGDDSVPPPPPKTQPEKPVNPAVSSDGGKKCNSDIPAEDGTVLSAKSISSSASSQRRRVSPSSRKCDPEGQGLASDFPRLKGFLPFRRSFSDEALCAGGSSSSSEGETAKLDEGEEETKTETFYPMKALLEEDASSSLDCLCVGAGCAFRLKSAPSLSTRRSAALYDARHRTGDGRSRPSASSASVARCSLLTSHEKFKRAALRLAFGVEGVLDAGAGTTRLQPLPSSRKHSVDAEEKGSQKNFKAVPPNKRQDKASVMGKTLLERNKFSRADQRAAAEEGGRSLEVTELTDVEKKKTADEQDSSVEGKGSAPGTLESGTLGSNSFLRGGAAPFKDSTVGEASLKCRVGAPKLRHEDFDWSAAKVLGRGRSSLVYFVRHKASGLPLAVKEILVGCFDVSKGLDETTKKNRYQLAAEIRAHSLMASCKPPSSTGFSRRGSGESLAFSEAPAPLKKQHSPPSLAATSTNNKDLCLGLNADSTVESQKSLGERCVGVRSLESACPTTSEVSLPSLTEEHTAFSALKLKSQTEKPRGEDSSDAFPLSDGKESSSRLPTFVLPFLGAHGWVSRRGGCVHLVFELMEGGSLLDLLRAAQLVRTHWLSLERASPFFSAGPQNNCPWRKPRRPPRAGIAREKEGKELCEGLFCEARSSARVHRDNETISPDSNATVPLSLLSQDSLSPQTTAHLASEVIRPSSQGSLKEETSEGCSPFAAPQQRLAAKEDFFLFERTSNCANFCESREPRRIRGSLGFRRGVPEPFLRLIAFQALDALCFLHDKRCIHRDIKPQNILIAKNGIIKVADLGVSRVLGRDEEENLTFVGTESYMSPERLFSSAFPSESYSRPSHTPLSNALSGQTSGKAICDSATGDLASPPAPYSFSADVWALGVCLFELAILEHPFRNGLPGCLSDQHVSSLLQHRLRGVCTPEFRDFLFCCLRVEPQKRKSAEQLLMHPWLLEDMSPLDKFARWLERLYVTADEICVRTFVEEEAKRGFLAASSEGSSLGAFLWSAAAPVEVVERSPAADVQNELLHSTQRQPNSEETTRTLGPHAQRGAFNPDGWRGGDTRPVDCSVSSALSSTSEFARSPPCSVGHVMREDNANKSHAELGTALPPPQLQTMHCLPTQSNCKTGTRRCLCNFDASVDMAFGAPEKGCIGQCWHMTSQGEEGELGFQEETSLDFDADDLHLASQKAATDTRCRLRELDSCWIRERDHLCIKRGSPTNFAERSREGAWSTCQKVGFEKKKEKVRRRRGVLSPAACCRWECRRAKALEAERRSRGNRSSCFSGPEDRGGRGELCQTVFTQLPSARQPFGIGEPDLRRDGGIAGSHCLPQTLHAQKPSFRGSPSPDEAERLLEEAVRNSSQALWAWRAAVAPRAFNSQQDASAPPDVRPSRLHFCNSSEAPRKARATVPDEDLSGGTSSRCCARAFAFPENGESDCRRGFEAPIKGTSFYRLPEHTATSDSLKVKVDKHELQAVPPPEHEQLWQCMPCSRGASAEQYSAFLLTCELHGERKPD